MADKEASIVIKKIKKGGHAGHHGGAWKVAYADFVTAMMAFFLLLWLLQATAQSQKEGIAEYFTPTIGVRDSAGIGFKGGKTSYDEGRKVEERSPPGILVGRMPQGPTAQKVEKQSPAESTEDAYLFEKGEKMIKQAIEEDPNFRDFKDNVIVEQNPEGLKISLIDDDKLPMFEPKGSVLTQAGEKILRRMGDVIKAMPNRISIVGHTEATNYADSAQYSNWELTADRANAARRFLMLNNLEPTRVAKVSGRADQELLDPKHPTSPRNRRIEIILLRNSYLKTLEENTPAPMHLLTVPRPNTITEKPVKAAPRAAAKASSKVVKEAPPMKVEKTNVNPLTSQEFQMPENVRRLLNGGSTEKSPAEDEVVPQSLISVPKAEPLPSPKQAQKPVAPPPPKPKPAPRQEETPAVGVDESNVNSSTGEFKMPDNVRQLLNGGTKVPGGDQSVPEGLLSAPEAVVPPVSQPKAAPAPPPAPKPAPKPAASDEEPGADVDQSNINSLSTEFKMPDAVRRSLESPGTAPATNAAPGGGLNSPSGVIEKDEQ